jgi:hypothetical protein
VRADMSQCVRVLPLEKVVAFLLIFFMFKRNLRIVLHSLSCHTDVLSIHLLLSFKTGPSYICVVVQSPL